MVCAYSWSCAVALAVMYCESGGVPTKENYRGSGARGLFQIMPGWATGNPDYWTRWMEPAWNIATAFNIYVNHGGWRNWAGCL